MTKTILAAAAVLLATTGLAAATPTVNSFGFTAVGGASVNTGDLMTGTSFAIYAPFETTGSGTGDLSGIGPGTMVSLSNTSYLITPTSILEIISPFTVSVAGNVFTLDEQEVTVRDSAVIGGVEHATLTVGFTGTGTGAGFTDAATSATYTLNQTGGVLSAVAFAATVAVPTAVPEPATLAVLGLGLIALGFVRYGGRARTNLAA